MNQIGQSVTVEMVEKFQLYENYQQSFPVAHRCKIVLYKNVNIEKRKADVWVEGPDILILIQAIANEKVVFKRTKDEEELSWKPQTVDRFQRYAEYPYSAFVLNALKAPSANELLSRLFASKNLDEPSDEVNEAV